MSIWIVPTFWLLVNNAALNNYLQVLRGHMFQFHLGKCLGVVLLSQMLTLYINIWGNCRVFKSGCNILHFLQYPHQLCHYLSIWFWPFWGVRSRIFLWFWGAFLWRLMCLFPIFISFLEKHVFRSLACFVIFCHFVNELLKFLKYILGVSLLSDK